MPTKRKCECEMCKTCRARQRAIKSRALHPERYRAKSAAWFTANKERKALHNRKAYFKGKYGITLEQREELLRKQNNLCACCHQSFTLKRINVDHDHKTGAIRGLLCTQCNAGIGQFEDNVERLQQAINYLYRVHPQPGIMQAPSITVRSGSSSSSRSR